MGSLLIKVFFFDWTLEGQDKHKKKNLLYKDSATKIVLNDKKMTFIAPIVIFKRKKNPEEIKIKFVCTF